MSKLLEKLKKEEIINLLEELNKTTIDCSNGYGGGSEGNLLIKKDEDYEKQLLFLESYILKIKPNTVLETGTNSGCFGLVLKLIDPKIKLFTFGIDWWSKNTTDILNKKYGNYIEFILGDSKETLSDFYSSNKIDMAWVDGDHSTEGALKDLENCKRLKIENIFIDDCNLSNEVLHAVEIFSKNNNLIYHDRSDDRRGIIYLKCDWSNEN